MRHGQTGGRWTDERFRQRAWPSTEDCCRMRGRGCYGRETDLSGNGPSPAEKRDNGPSPVQGSGARPGGVFISAQQQAHGSLLRQVRQELSPNSHGAQASACVDLWARAYLNPPRRRCARARVCCSRVCSDARAHARLREHQARADGTTGLAQSRRRRQPSGAYTHVRAPTRACVSTRPERMGQRA